jgi:hypothetical protein
MNEKSLDIERIPPPPAPNPPPPPTSPSTHTCHCHKPQPIRESKEITDCCILTAGLETNGPQGGNSSHGGYTAIWFKLLNNEDCAVEIVDETGRPHIFKGVRSFKYTGYGDAESRVLGEACTWLGERLRVHGHEYHEPGTR